MENARRTGTSLTKTGSVRRKGAPERRREGGRRKDRLSYLLRSAGLLFPTDYVLKYVGGGLGERGREGCLPQNSSCSSMLLNFLLKETQICRQALGLSRSESTFPAATTVQVGTGGYRWAGCPGGKAQVAPEALTKVLLSWKLSCPDLLHPASPLFVFSVSLLLAPTPRGNFGGDAASTTPTC